METIVSILGAILAAFGIAATYHIAVRQGIFGKENILLTVSQPTPYKKGEPLPAYAKVFRLGGLGPADSIYPFLLKMPLCITFGVANKDKPRVVFLLVSVLNMKPTPVPDISVHIFMPAKWMPDPKLICGHSQGLEIRRSIDESTEEGHVEYLFERLKPYDCIVVAEPLFVRPEDIIDAENQLSGMAMLKTKMRNLRFILQTTKTISEERLWLAVVRSQCLEKLVDQSTFIANELMRGYPQKIKKPLIRRLLHIPAAYRAVLCVQPGFFSPSPEIAVHSYGRAGERTKSHILGIMLK